MKTLYFDCKSGISGDMTVAALLDLKVPGVDLDFLNSQLALLHLHGQKIWGHAYPAAKSGIQGTKFEVMCADEGEHSHNTHHHSHPEPVYHDMEEYLHTHRVSDHCHDREHEHDHNHESDHDHNHDHGHPHEHGHGGNDGHGRNLHDIFHIFNDCPLPHEVRLSALKAFKLLAEAEAKVHGSTVEDIHFHEVGAVDSIADIASVAILLHAIAPDKVIFSEISEGNGYVRCDHGLMPVPVPATLELLTSHGIPFRQIAAQGELVTPTGAVIAASFGTEHGAAIPRMTGIRTGVGCGTKDFPQANILRVLLGNTAEGDLHRDEVTLLEANIDDMSGEALAYAAERLMEGGALDVWHTPILMKKGRPAVTLSVLCKPGDAPKFAEAMLLHTTTIGVRYRPMNRMKMERTVMEVQTPSGPALIKVSSYQDITKAIPEYSSASEIARKTGKTLDEVYKEIADAYKTFYKPH